MTPDLLPVTRVQIAGIDISIGDLIVLLIKVAIASIPAALVLSAAVGLFVALMTAAIGVR